MTRKLIYNTETQLLQPWPRADDGEIVGLAPHLLEMEVIELETPEIDEATQRLEFSRDIDVQAKTVTQGMVAVDKSAEEIAQDRRVMYPDAEAVAVRDWLLDQGITAADVEAQIALMFLDDQLATAKALNRWGYAVRVPRDHPLVVALGEALGFTQAQLDTEWANVLKR
jgi:hypothetical protein